VKTLNKADAIPDSLAKKGKKIHPSIHNHFFSSLEPVATVPSLEKRLELSILLLPWRQN
jgi:hypothetical protein